MLDRWRNRFGRIPIRGKLLVTLLGAAAAILGASTYLSFGYWRREALAAAEEQALLAAGSVRAAVEAELRSGRPAEARRSLRKLTEGQGVTAARVYSADGRVVLSGRADEEGRRGAAVWIPAPNSVPAEGVVRQARAGGSVRAFLPLYAPDAAALELEFSVAPLTAAMDRGARLGLGLLVVSLLTLAGILITFFDREVASRIRRMAVRLESQQQQLAQQAGLAEVGELAAEMAHELKRPLASVRTALDVLGREYVVDERGQRLLEAVEGQLDKLTETMRDLFALARPDGLDWSRVEPKRLLDGALALLAGHPAVAGLQVRREYDEAAPPAWGDARRLEQAVLNLLMNAAEAMPRGGTLTLRARQSDTGALVVEVEDTGAGMGPAELERVMRPFYSTKPQGTGLGLPLVARIVAAHHGRIGIDSRPGVGTTVRIQLPSGGRPAGQDMEAARWPKPESSSSRTTSSFARS